ncbi:hypothetical protein MTO96_031234 [Rhipicephalus appendiculatus]
MRLLSDLGSAVDIDEDIPLKRYFRSGKEMVRMAEVYHKEGDLERTYILYTKYITLFVEKIYKHPAMKTPPYLIGTKQRRPEVFTSISCFLIVFSQKLNEVFPIAEKLKAELLEKYTQEYKILLKNKERQEAEEALQEERRKKEQLERLMYEQQKQFALQQREQQAKMVQPERPETPTPPPGGISPSDVYPVLLELENGGFKALCSSLGTCGCGKEGNSSCGSEHKAFAIAQHRALYYPSNQGLRTVVVPGGLFSKFLHLSRQNTEKNIETCAIMAGKFARNQLSITHLLVPKQSGTADSCFTESEEEMLEYQDELGLDTIGWVHTHPTQTAFMSSVDLHTHCSYQLMLPEAVAIVCSPKYEENKIFSLTVDHGLPFISGCRATGFHPHPNEPPLYEECRHVKVDEKAPITVVDLRG